MSRALGVFVRGVRHGARQLCGGRNCNGSGDGVFVRGVRHGARQLWGGCNGNGSGDGPIDYKVLLLECEKRGGKLSNRVVELDGEVKDLKVQLNEVNEWQGSWME